MKPITFKIAFAICVGATFFATLYIPYCYDQYNLMVFSNPAIYGDTLIREYGKEVISGALISKDADPTTAFAGLAKTANDFLSNRRLIALDYVHQMKAATRLVTRQVVIFTVILGLFVIVVTLGALLTIKDRKIRGPILAIIFVAGLCGMQVFGLPHINYKFHVIIGTAFAVLVLLTDLIRTADPHLPEPIPPSDPRWHGYLSAIQYKHRFWSAIFSMGVATILTALLTVSFVAFDVFERVFGEGFVVAPLVGISVAVVIGLVWSALGILLPIARRLEILEAKMFEAPP